MNEFKTGTKVYYATQICELTIDADKQGISLHDGIGITGGHISVLEQCRNLTPFIEQVVKLLKDYKHQMSESHTLNWKTSSVFNHLVLNFIDTYTNLDDDDASEAWTRLYGYKNRLLELKQEYDLNVMELR